MKNEGTDFPNTDRAPLQTRRSYHVFFCFESNFYVELLIKAVQFKSGVCVRLTFLTHKVVLFAYLHFMLFYVVLRCKNKLEKLPKLEISGAVQWKHLESEQSPGFQAGESRPAFT